MIFGSDSAPDASANGTTTCVGTDGNSWEHSRWTRQHGERVKLSGGSYRGAHALFAEYWTVLARIAENERMPVRERLGLEVGKESAEAGVGQRGLANSASIAVIEQNTGVRDCLHGSGTTAECGRTRPDLGDPARLYRLDEEPEGLGSAKSRRLETCQSDIRISDIRISNK